MCIRDRVRALGIREGDRAVFADTVSEMANPDFLCGRAMDNRAGCTVVCELRKLLSLIHI